MQQQGHLQHFKYHNLNDIGVRNLLEWRLAQPTGQATRKSVGKGWFYLPQMGAGRENLQSRLVNCKEELKYVIWILGVLLASGCDEHSVLLCTDGQVLNQPQHFVPPVLPQGCILSNKKKGVLIQLVVGILW
jgi:hypothetical protein